MRVCGGAPFVAAYRSLIKPIFDFFSLGKNINKLGNSQVMPSLKFATPQSTTITINIVKLDEQRDLENYKPNGYVSSIKTDLLSVNLKLSREKLIEEVTALDNVCWIHATRGSEQMKKAQDKGYSEGKIKNLMIDLENHHTELDNLLKEIEEKPEELARHHHIFRKLKQEPGSVRDFYNFCQQESITCDANLHEDGTSLFASFRLLPVGLAI